MLSFRSLRVYRCALEALPLTYQLAERADADTKKQLRRAALSINLNIAEGTGRRDADQRQFYRVARGSALECGAVLDAMGALGLVSREEIAPIDELLVQIVKMLTKMTGEGEGRV
jgi:four helix bundle protein